MREKKRRTDVTAPGILFPLFPALYNNINVDMKQNPSLEVNVSRIEFQINAS